MNTGTIEIVDLSSDDEGAKVIPKAVKLEPDFVSGAKQQNETNKGIRSHSVRQDSEENISSNGPSTGHSSSSVLDPGLSTVDDADLSSSSSIHAAPICRQFWKAGNYDDELRSKVKLQSNLTSIF